MGVGGAALRGSVADELGHRRPRRPRPRRDMVVLVGRGDARAQPVARRGARAPTAAEPVLPCQPPVAEPARAARRGDARRASSRRRAEPIRERRARARRTQVDRPRRRVPSQARRVRSAVLVVDSTRRRGQPHRLRCILHRARDGPSHVRRLLRARRAARRRLAGVATELPLPVLGTRRALRS